MHLQLTSFQLLYFGLLWLVILFLFFLLLYLYMGFVFLFETRADYVSQAGFQLYPPVFNCQVLSLQHTPPHMTQHCFDQDDR